MLDNLGNSGCGVCRHDIKTNEDAHSGQTQMLLNASGKLQATLLLSKSQLINILVVKEVWANLDIINGL